MYHPPIVASVPVDQAVALAGQLELGVYVGDDLVCVAFNCTWRGLPGVPGSLLLHAQARPRKPEERPRYGVRVPATSAPKF